MHASSCLSRSSFAGFTIALDDRFSVAALYGLDMRLPGTMATLAVDALGKCIAEPGAAAIICDERTWVAVVTRHAPRIDGPPEVHVGGPIITPGSSPKSRHVRRTS